MIFRRYMNNHEYINTLPQIAELFQRAYGRSVDQDLLAWRYASSVIDHEQAFVELVEYDGTLAAHYGCSVASLRKGSQEFLAGITGAVMTDPAVQGKGLFRNSGDACHEMMVKAGFDLEFAFPNRNSNPIFLLKMGWKPIYEIPTLSLNLDKNSINESSETFEFDSDFSKFDYSQELMPNDHLLHVPRVKEFFDWRFIGHPKNSYKNLVIGEGERLKAMAVIKFYTVGTEKMIDVVDFQAIDQPAFRAVMKKLESYARSEDCKTINIWAPVHHYSHQELLRAGYFLSGPITYISYKSITVDDSFDASNFSNWWITMADSDVY